MSTVVSAVAAVASGVTKAVELVKVLKETDKALTVAEYKVKLAEVYETLADTKMHLVGFKDQQTMYLEQIKDLKEQLALALGVEWKKPFFWQWKDGKWDGPFCRQCWETDNRLVSVVKKDSVIWKCTTCDCIHREPVLPMEPAPRGLTTVRTRRGRSR